MAINTWNAVGWHTDIILTSVSRTTDIVIRTAILSCHTGVIGTGEAGRAARAAISTT